MGDRAISQIYTDNPFTWDGTEILVGIKSGVNGAGLASGLALLAADDDGTLAANSATKFATQRAVKQYIDALLAASDAVIFKGVTDCSANPNYPAADAGHLYIVSVAGKIGGSSGVVVEVGDFFICKTDATSSGNQATVGSHWGIIQTNLVGAALTSGNLSQFAATTSAQLLALLTDPTGTGVAVFATNPVLVNPVVGTQTAGDNTTKAASTAFVTAAIAALGGGGGGGGPPNEKTNGWSKTDGSSNLAANTADFVYSLNNRKVTQTTTEHDVRIRADALGKVTPGQKVYFEIKAGSSAGAGWAAGLQTLAGTAANGYAGNSNDIMFSGTGITWVNGAYNDNNGGTVGANGVIGIAWEVGVGVTVYYNNVPYSYTYPWTEVSAVPALTDDSYYSAGLKTWEVCMSASQQTYAAPSGYSPWVAATPTPFTGGTLTSALNEAPAVTLASASTVNIGAAAANTINITGTTGITAFDTIAAGAIRRLIFGGALIITHNGTSLQNISGANITTVAGDVAEVESLGSGNWKMLSYTRKDGTALVSSGGGGSTSFPINAQTGTSYTLQATDNSKHVTLSNASSIAVALPQAGTTGFLDGWFTVLENIGTNKATITPTSSTINGAASLVIDGGMSAIVFSDGTNYRAIVIGTRITVNLQTGTSYTYVTADRGKLVSHANASAIAGTLPQAVNTFGSGWWMWVQNTGTGTLTITPTTSTIDGVSSLALTTGQGVLIASNGTDYYTMRGASSGGGGLTNWTDAISTSSPNSGVNAASLTATGAGSSIAAIIRWKSSGYFAVQVPDGTTTGGNVRGAHAVDFQNTRSAAANVASGTRSALLATNDAVASGTNSAVVASDRGSVAGDQSFSTGSRHTSTGDNSFIQGNFGTDRGHARVLVRAYSSNSQGEAQTIHYGLQATIAYSSTPKNITIAAGGASATSIPILPNNSVAAFVALVHMGNSGAVQFLAAKIEGFMKRGSNAASTAFVGTPTVTYLGRTSGTATTDWSVDCAVDTTNGGLLVRGTDAGASGIVSLSADVWYPTLTC